MSYVGVPYMCVNDNISPSGLPLAFVASFDLSMLSFGVVQSLLSNSYHISFLTFSNTYKSTSSGFSLMASFKHMSASWRYISVFST
uniref:Uncharacterized protein n=1 Tax=Tanacetum cinerariifolium TaxID=118510 RepID=A0A699TZQ8_TANCI|nr:hypothetical protein [Tanacetum cinerariifolium]